MSSGDDIAVARRFEPTDDGHFLHRDLSKEYKLTRAQATLLACRIERAQASLLLFCFFMAFHTLDLFFDLDDPGVWGSLWLAIRGVAAFLALGAAVYSAMEGVKTTALLKDCASSEIDKIEGPAKPWWQRYDALRTSPEYRRTGTRNLVLLGVTFSVWFVVSSLALLTSPSWLSDGSAWLAGAGEDWFVQGVLYLGAAVFFVLFLVVVALSLLVVAVCLETLRGRFHRAEFEGTNGA